MPLPLSAGISAMFANLAGSSMAERLTLDQEVAGSIPARPAMEAGGSLKEPGPGKLCVVVLAAGRGTRLKTSQPKPLLSVCGAPILAHVLDSLSLLKADHVVVVLPPDSEEIQIALRERAAHLPVLVAIQPIPRGTGDAALVGLEALPPAAGNTEDDDVIILPGDAPLLRAESLRTLLATHRRAQAACTMLTALLDDPTGYGRILRNPGSSEERSGVKVVEQADAAPEELLVREVATSVYTVKQDFLRPVLSLIGTNNAAGEVYLPDIINRFDDLGHSIATVTLDDATEALGVNTQSQLSAVRSEMQRRINERWMANGVEMRDPSSTFIDVTVDIEPGAVLLPGVLLEGRTRVGRGSVIGPHSRLTDCVVGTEAVIELSVCRGAEVSDGRVVGPFAYLEESKS